MKNQVEEFDGFYNKLLEGIESNLTFLGVVLIQDVLNEGFSESLQFMNECMIRVGILSGDILRKV